MGWIICAAGQSVLKLVRNIPKYSEYRLKNRFKSLLLIEKPVSGSAVIQDEDVILEYLRFYRVAVRPGEKRG